MKAGRVTGGAQGGTGWHTGLGFSWAAVWTQGWRLDRETRPGGGGRQGHRAEQRALSRGQ